MHPVSRRNQVAFPDPPLAADIDLRRTAAADDDRGQPWKQVGATFGVDERLEPRSRVNRSLLESRYSRAGDENRRHAREHATRFSHPSTHGAELSAHGHK